MTVAEEIKTGKWVYGFDAEIRKRLLATETLCFRLNGLSPEQEEERGELIKNIFGKIDSPFTVHSPFHCDFGKNITIGKNFVANYNLTILDEADVTIGNNVFVGPNCSVYTVIHAMLPEQRNQGVMKALPVVIGDNVWIGGNVVILPGVTIGNGAVIGAGSVVAKDVPAATFAFGNPCMPKRNIAADKDIAVMENDVADEINMTNCIGTWF